MSFEVLSLFFFSACLLALTPGPDNIFVLSQSLAYGAKAGILVTLGLCSGLLVHTTLVAVGLAAFIAASPVFLNLIKLVGVSYLLYLAWQSWRLQPDSRDATAVEALASGHLYRRGIVMNVTNPKVGLFFIAFLPQFVQADRWPVPLQVAALGLLFILSTLLVFGGIALLSGVYNEKMTASPARRKLMNRLVSAVFVGLALNLLLLAF